MAFPLPRAHPVLPRFERVDLCYKTLGSTEFEAAILVSHSLASSSRKTNRPLLVHFHGGGLLMGTILDSAILSVWPLELAENENAVVVSPAYRLLPEAKGGDILDDIKDFWIWVRSSLPTEIAKRWPHISLDVDRAAVFGESAGGYLSLQSAFLCPEANIKLVMPQYGAMFPDIDEYLPKVPQSTPGSDDIVDAYLKNIEPGAIRLLSPYPTFGPFAGAVAGAGRHRDLLGDDKRLNLDYGLNNVKVLPPVWVAQGTDDTIVSKEASDELVKRIRNTHPNTPLLYSVQPGGHGFDNDHTLAEPWITEAMEFVQKHWP
ncbi:alpha/beta-hydrolase [Microthyrium microscopicum]|uniref:Alpha/beta-hydrolase n=1 Tax=Microthyrium microscopicum TaxID=703497 RepID=A0A6A6UBK6_9PEZI|nr:alpha/beta-hydrolase [Microthyrium microscopicum]